MCGVGGLVYHGCVVCVRDVVGVAGIGFWCWICVPCCRHMGAMTQHDSFIWGGYGQ